MTDRYTLTREELERAIEQALADMVKADDDLLMLTTQDQGRFKRNAHILAAKVWRKVGGK